MIRRWMVVPGAVSVFLAFQVCAGEAPVLNSVKDKVSYATGVDLVRSFQRQGVEVDRSLFLKGVEDGLSGGSLLMKEEEIGKALKLFRAEQNMKHAERKQRQAEESRKRRPAPVAPDNTNTRP